MPSCPPASFTDTRAPWYNPRWLLATVLSFLLIALWDASGQDLALAHVWGTAQGFALRDDHFLVTYMHQGMRNLGWVIVLALSLGVWLPFGLLRQLPTARRVQLLVSILASLAVVAILKRSSATSCPWDLSIVGGVAEYVSHWRWGVHDGGAGRCFPAGHAAAGFSFVGGYFALARDTPRAARWWLAVALAVGLLLGLGQQMRGAHYMSHTLWTAWLCWTAGLAIDMGMARRRSQTAD
ncbi:MAG: phosphatase PAP2 family protein [Comamonas sp.]|jgi:membrane-associated PAP2 superfamily phosphatase|nr:phosphatase PAP2 family protein [Comamonas sp.]